MLRSQIETQIVGLDSIERRVESASGRVIFLLVRGSLSNDDPLYEQFGYRNAHHG